MKKLVSLFAIPAILPVVIPGNAHACIRSIICANGKTNYALMRQQQERAQLAQYVPTQYYPAQMMSGGGSPVIVPPTVINTQGYEHNSSKKSCKESVIDMFLFSVRRTTGDCTP